MADEMRVNVAAMLKMVDEVASPDGPGAPGWHGAGSHTVRFNDAVMEALRRNRGRVPGDFQDLQLLILTTTGARSGQPRAVPLAYHLLDDRLLVVASMGGNPRHPPWFHNLVANPEVTVELDGETFRARANVTQGADRDALFARICANMPNFAEYQKSAGTRVIPVVELKRR